MKGGGAYDAVHAHHHKQERQAGGNHGAVLHALERNDGLLCNVLFGVDKGCQKHEAQRQTCQHHGVRPWHHGPGGIDGQKEQGEERDEVESAKVVDPLVAGFFRVFDRDVDIGVDDCAREDDEWYLDQERPSPANRICLVSICIHRSRFTYH